MKEMNREEGVTAICSTHDHRMQDISGRIIWMRDGKTERIADRSDVKNEVDEVASLPDQDSSALTSGPTVYSEQTPQ